MISATDRLSSTTPTRTFFPPIFAPGCGSLFQYWRSRFAKARAPPTSAQHAASAAVGASHGNRAPALGLKLVPAAWAAHRRLGGGGSRRRRGGRGGCRRRRPRRRERRKSAAAGPRRVLVREVERGVGFRQH